MGFLPCAVEMKIEDNLKTKLCKTAVYVWVFKKQYTFVKCSIKEPTVVPHSIQCQAADWGKSGS